MGEAVMGRGAVEAVWRRGQRRGAKHGAQEVRAGKPDGQRWGQVHIQLGREHGMTLRSGKRCRMTNDVDIACSMGMEHSWWMVSSAMYAWSSGVISSMHEHGASAQSGDHANTL